MSRQADELPYGEDSSYRLCVGTLCESGAPRVYGDTVLVSLHPADGFDVRRPDVRIQLSGPKGAPELGEARTITSRQRAAGCARALSGAPHLTAGGVLEESRQSRQSK